MNVAIPFKNHNKLNEKVQEFNIFFDSDKNSFDNLIEFIQTYDKYIINIEYRNGIDVKTAKALSSISDNVFFRLRAEDITKIDKLVERKCKFFFDHTVSANNWITLYNLIQNYHVSSLYICDDLAYEFEEVCKVCHENNVKVRMVINRAPFTRSIAKDTYIAPIYRPQDVSTLEKMGLDIVEFDCGKPYNFKKLDVLYKNYIEKKDWYGTLGEINPDFEEFDLPCRGLNIMLASKRSNCGLKCLKGSKCNACQNLVVLARSLRDIGAQLAV